ncbi:MAG: YciI family protein [Mycobacterium sp.]
MADELFFVRLIPPRADFSQTMTEAEQQVMRQHQSFWRELLAEGRVVVFGPVADPEGAWGLGVVRAESRVEVIEYCNVDPAVASGLMTFETFEIQGARTG